MSMPEIIIDSDGIEIRIKKERKFKLTWGGILAGVGTVIMVIEKVNKAGEEA